MVLKDHVVNGSFIVCVKSSTGASSESVLKMLATFSHLMNYNDWCYQALVLFPQLNTCALQWPDSQITLCISRQLPY